MTTQSTVEDIYPLTPMQQGMLFHTLYAPGSGIYLLQMSFRIGGLDPAAFKRALAQVIERHAVLRTSFAWKGLGQPVQVVHREAPFPVREEDWSGLPEAGRRQRLEDYLTLDAVEGFDLELAPPTRFLLAREAGDSFRLVWTIHHLLVDGWSTARIIGELFACYGALQQGQGALLLEPSRRYRDYIAWLAQQDPRQAKSFWQQELAGFNEPTPLPGERRLGRVEGTLGQSHALLSEVLSEEATEALQAFTQTHQLTLNTLVQGAWAVLLSRLSHRQSIVFGVTVSGRPPELPGAETIVGLFINTLPLRAEVDAEALLVDWLRRLQDRHSEARQFGHVPLVEIQGWSELPRGTPLFESLLVFESYPVDAQVRKGGSGLVIDDLRIREANNFPLTLVGTPGRRLSLALAWDRSRFDGATAGRLLSYLAELLHGMVRRPEARLESLDHLPAGERHQLLVEWNGGGGGDGNVEAGSCLHRLFAAQAARRPDAVAVTGEGSSLTYGELNCRANRMAHHLIALGAGPEVPIALCLERTPEMVVAILAVLKTGGAYVPLDPAHPAERQRLVLEDCRAPLLIAHRHLAEQLPLHGMRLLPVDPEAGEEWANAAEVDPEIGVHPQSLAYVIYTSGSTGRPKGTLVAHAQVSRLFSATGAWLGFGEGDVWSLFHSYAFDFSVWEMWGALLHGGRLAVVPWLVSRSPESFRELLAREGITVLNQTPTAFHQLVRADAAVQGKTALRLVIFGGEALEPESLSPWIGRHGDERPRLINMYGITETTVHVTYRRMTAADVGQQASPIGVSLPDLRVHLLDPVLRPVPIGIPGEIYVGGAGVARGYLGRPDLTAQRFVPDPFSAQPGERLYRAGDLARHLPDGEMEFLGRIDHQVKIRGFRIELGEIESALAACPGVQEAAVLVLGTGAEQKLAAYLAPEDLSPAALRSFLRTRLPEPMIPASWVLLPSLPLSPNGKVDRRALTRIEPGAPGRHESERPPSEPLGRIEGIVASVWCEVLGVERVGRNESFFDLGGHSVLLIRAQGRLAEELGREISLVDLFRYPTVGALAGFLEPAAAVSAPAPRRRTVAPEDRRIAVIGMAGRFPGASSVEAFWQNLCAGVESISFHTAADLAAAGGDPAAFSSPRFVAANGVIEGIELFDAGFFGYTPRDAEIADPQYRLFLECAWESLESAGYAPEGCPGPIGVFAGISRSEYVWNLLSNRELLQSVGANRIGLSTDKDFLATTVSYKLDLKGPSFSIQTACSTSLVAVHVACRSLLAGECDMALAGGSSISVPQQTGYLYQEGGIRSPDGHCRAFDARAGGLVAGNGAGVVVLKRLEDALADGDPVRAVILGSAVNNDGAAKVGYTAPGVDGQSEVIRSALEAGGVDPRTVGLIEAHGTGTPLGDPIEVAALTRAFREAGAEEAGFCALGSVKTNIGHLDAAAGVAGLIKAALAVERGLLPPSLHFTSPNPAIDFAASPFRVNERLREWRTEGGPRRAGVSSFGIGGTNAHAVLEEPPAAEPGSPPRHPWQLLVLSARSETALGAAAGRLRRWLEERPETDLVDLVDLGDAAWTLQAGRRAFAHRRAVLCRDAAEAQAALARPGGERAEEERGVFFLFPGQGAQYPGMGLGLYRTEPVFREEMDRASEILRPRLGCALRELLADGRMESEDTAFVQPALFAVEHALARLWMSWGIRPQAVIGHSLGEYVAACVAGAFSFEDGLALVAERGRLLGDLPHGAMASLPLSEEEVAPLLAGGLSLAAVNAPAQCVVSGSEEEVRGLLERLAVRGVAGRRLRTSHAFHSAMVEPAVAPFLAAVRRVRLSPPRIPWVSNLTGTWISKEEATDPAYWARHLRSTVRFAAGLTTLLHPAEGRPAPALLEVGPGRTLSALARRHPDRTAAHPVVVSLRHSEDTKDDSETLLTALGQLWSAGARVDWRAFRGGERRRRVALPTYPFERRRYWIERERVPATPEPPAPARRELADWFWTPYWKPAPPLSPMPVNQRAEGPWLVVLPGEEGRGQDIAEALLDHLRQLGAELVILRPGTRPSRREDYDALLAGVARDRTALPSRVLHLGNVAPPEPADGFTERLARLEREKERGFYSLLVLLQALGDRGGAESFEITVVTACAQRVAPGDLPCPERAMMLALCRVAPRESPGLTCRAIDIGFPLAPSWLARIAGDIAVPSTEPLVAWRGGERWLPDLAPLRLTESAPLRPEGVWLVTGGLGGIGLEVAEHLAASRARLVLVGRTGLPPETEWERDLARNEPADASLAPLLARREAELRRELGVRGIASRPGAQEALDAFCAARLLQFLVESGIEIRRGAEHRRADLREALHLRPKLYRFLDFLLEVLAEDGWVRMDGDTAVVQIDAVEAPDPAALAVAAAERHPALRPIFERIEQCAASYGPTLAGSQETLGDLVSGAYGGETESLFHVPVYTRLAAEIAVHAAETVAVEGRGLRVLEIGGGHGSLTRQVAPALAGRGAEYWFTDLGRLFVTDAELAARREGLDFLRFGVLDASRDPVAQGYAAESFDLIFALNVVHATPDVEASLSHLWKLLRPGGSLCLIELTQRQRWGDMIWGLTEGWWHFSDSFRQGSPLLDLDSWRKVLARTGFEVAVTLPANGDERADSDCGLLLATRPAVSRTASRASRIRHMRDLGAEVVVEAADVADAGALRAVACRAVERFGRLDGVIHAAGVPGGGLIELRTRESLEEELAAKVRGTLAVGEVCRELSPAHLVLFSSTSAFTGQLGQAGYCAGNAFLDAWAHLHAAETGAAVLTLDWDRWQGTGMAVAVERRHRELTGLAAAGGMTPAEGVEAFARALAGGRTQLIVSPEDFAARLAHERKPAAAEPGAPGVAARRSAPASLHERPDLATGYVPPSDELERDVAEVWQEVFGMQRIGIHDDFFELGGDSLVALQLVSRLGKVVGLELRVRSLFDAPTISALAVFIEEAMLAGASEEELALTGDSGDREAAS